ncbi:MAG: PhzF family phenazine biosynthesis protein [Emcibacteraceae bacterium]|nr:PhzF family phenazine biosynthesis protein [Emcibacteraceae bacterium]
MTEKTINYSIEDVFTDQRFSGNPLAVIHDGSTLTTEEMQQIAIEFGFSETSVICPPKDNHSNANIRIFTPMEEVPFAGHPNIGTAFVVANEATAARFDGSENLIFDEKGGIVKVTLKPENGQTNCAEIIAPQSLEIKGNCDPKLMADCLGLCESKIITSTNLPCVATIGLAFSFVEVCEVSDLADIKLSLNHFKKAASIGPKTVDDFAICAFAITEQSDREISLRSRVFSPFGHPVEDPATGSASGALGALLAKKQNLAPLTINITQGVEMGRKSDITIDIEQLTSQPKISGNSVKVSQGVIYL